MSQNKVEFDLRVGLLDISFAQLLTKDHHLIEFPTLLLPEDVKAGSIVRITCERDVVQESEDEALFEKTQDMILEQFTSHLPKKPVLRAVNTTQTTLVLGWDPIDIGTAEIESLSLYKNGQQLGRIPTPLKRTATKLSNLAIDSEYVFHLVLRTSAGTFESEKLHIKTHRMTDLSGITICLGSLEGSEISKEDLVETVERLGAKPIQDAVKLDTTHFVCTKDEGRQIQRAKDLSIPIVRPEWLRACEVERRLVGVRQYYLTADPRLLPPVVARNILATPIRADSNVSRDSDSSDSENEPEPEQSAEPEANPRDESHTEKAAETLPEPEEAEAEHEVEETAEHTEVRSEPEEATTEEESKPLSDEPAADQTQELNLRKEEAVEQEASVPGPTFEPAVEADVVDAARVAEPLPVEEEVSSEHEAVAEPEREPEIEPSPELVAERESEAEAEPADNDPLPESTVEVIAESEATIGSAPEPEPEATATVTEIEVPDESSPKLGDPLDHASAEDISITTSAAAAVTASSTPELGPQGSPNLLRSISAAGPLDAAKPPLADSSLVDVSLGNSTPKLPPDEQALDESDGSAGEEDATESSGPTSGGNRAGSTGKKSKKKKNKRKH